MAVEIVRTYQDALADFLDCLRNLIKGGGERLDVFALQRRDEGLAKLLGQFLGDFFILAPAEDEFLEALRATPALQLGQERDQMVDTLIRLFCAGFEQIKEFFVVSEEFLDREHGQ